MKVYDNVIDAIGHTPVIRLNSVAKHVKPTIYVKFEAANPGGSIKDRIGIFIIRDAEKNGSLKPGGTIVEATSGNTGVGLAMAANILGYKLICTVSDKQSPDKINTLKAMGAKVVVCPADAEPEDPRSYYSVAKKLVEETPNAVLGNQYNNAANTQAHIETTGPEIWNQFEGKLDYYVAGMGTGGTISGVSRYLKGQNDKIKTFGVDPIGSILAEYHQTGKIGEAHSYLMEGLGEDIIPDNVHFDVIDECVKVDDQEATTMLHRLTREEGLFVGISSGAAVAGAIKAAEKLDSGNMLVIMPDGGGKYLGKFFNPEWLDKHNLKHELNNS